MFDLSPDKLVVLLALGLVILGPDKLPAAARGLAHGLARARRLAATLTQPIATLTEPITAEFTEPLRTGLAEPLKESLAQPRQAFDNALGELRSTIANHPLSVPGDQPSAAPADPAFN